MRPAGRLEKIHVDLTIVRSAWIFVCRRAQREHSPGPKAGKHSSIIILAGGATGTPMGANRSTPPALAPIGGMPAPGTFQGRRDDLAALVDVPRAGHLHATIAMFLRLRRCSWSWTTWWLVEFLSDAGATFGPHRGIGARPVWLGTMAS
jgi:hypothetical protein